MPDFSNASPRLFTFTACFIGFVLMGDTTASEQNALGNFFELIGQVLLTSAAQQAVIQSRALGETNNNINSREFKSIYDPLFYDIEKVRAILKSMMDNKTEDDLETINRCLKIMQNEIEKLKKEMGG